MLELRNVLLRLGAAGAIAAAMTIGPAGSAQAAPPFIPTCPKWDNPVPASGSITNTSSVGIGVFHLADGSCTKGAYDVILPPGANTRSYFGWGQAAGAYFGEGYSAYWWVNGSGKVSTTLEGPWIYSRAAGGNWSVYAYKQ